MNRKSIFVTIACFVISCFCSSLKISYGEDFYFAVQIQGYSNGIVLYDASFLEPRTGPGIGYTEYLQFNLKEGTPVQVFTISSDEAGNQWALVEGMVEKEPSRVYLLLYDARSQETTIQKQGRWNLPNEPSYLSYEDREAARSFLTNSTLRRGPGYNYQTMNISIDDRCMVVAIEGEWALVEFLIDEYGIWAGEYVRGWVPINSLRR